MLWHKPGAAAQPASAQRGASGGTVAAVDMQSGMVAPPAHVDSGAAAAAAAAGGGGGPRAQPSDTAPQADKEQLADVHGVNAQQEHNAALQPEHSHSAAAKGSNENLDARNLPESADTDRAHVFQKGDAVWYEQRGGDLAAATIAAVDSTLQPFAYAVDIDGSVRDTEANRLRPRTGAHLAARVTLSGSESLARIGHMCCTAFCQCSCGNQHTIHAASHWTCAHLWTGGRSGNGWTPPGGC